MLTTLTIRNFRSYEAKSYTFSGGATLIRGPNTAGKTNMLEAIMALATGKSFRAKREAEMVRWGSVASVISGRCAEQTDVTKLDVGITDGKKRYSVNGVPRRQVDFVGNFRAVLFWPEDLELITDSPSIRRKYLDGVLIQIDREYRRNLASYERGLRQRNRLLDAIREGDAAPNQLFFWNQLLIKAGAYLTEKRAEYIDFINNNGNGYKNYTAVYDKSVISETRLLQYAREEIAAATTLVGPHRDDVIVKELHDKTPIELSRYGSRGEQRLGVLWLKFAELSYIEYVTGVRPTLLLDDVFSELDPAHRKLIVGMVGKQQTIITSADPEISRELKSAIREIITL